MEVNDSLMQVIQDHVRITDTIDAICCAIENGTDLPNHIPVCNDLMVSDQLSKISETITNLRKKLL